MLAENLGYRFNHVDDANKQAQSAAFSRTKKEAVVLELEDYQVINKSEAAANTDKESRYNLDGSLKSDEGNPKDELLKMIFGKDGSSEVEYTPEIFKSRDSILKEHAENKHDGFKSDCPACECQTCKNRRYQDDSNDSGVSFQQPTQMNPLQASNMVKSHEMEHVRREQYKAKDEGRRIVSQSVQIKTDICPECGKTYVSGGVTRTRTKYSDPAFIDLFKVGAEDTAKKSGDGFNSIA